jgi:hypothetical protein
MPTCRLLLVLLLLGATSLRGYAGNSFDDTVRPLLNQYCVRCHGGANPKAGLNLAGFTHEKDALKDPGTWQRVWNVLRKQEMPPRKPYPTPEERARLTHSLAGLLDRAAREGGREPGHVVLRRLNQVEYNNTVLDLFGAYRATRTSGGTPYDPRRGMPERVRIVLHRQARERVVTLPPDDVGYGFTNIGEVLSLPPFLMEKYLAASRQVVEQLYRGSARRARRGRERPKIDPRAGARTFIARFSRRAFGRPLTEDEIKRHPAGSARRFLAAFGRRAFRRPMTDDELNRYLTLYEAASKRGEPFALALRLPVQAMLVSPHFLFRVEQGIDSEERDGLRPLNDHELATRLSYFLWSSLPDEELFRLADQGKLRDPAILEAQARRMLRHRYSKELGEQFGMQWLGLTSIRAAMPFPDRYPDFYRLKYLPEAMQQEALLLFETILVEDRSVLDFLDPGFTWLNETLLRFYDLDLESAERPSTIFWQRYPLADKRRGGVLTLGGTMLATSLAARTSPVKRGQWVLDALLGAPPPPPPPKVEKLDDTPAAVEPLSLRKRLERHRADPSCASCHRHMDGIGFGLENYDAIGAWREKDGGKPIDATGTFADGTPFNGPVELKQLLVLKRRDEFLRCLTEKMMTYALGRKLEYSDTPAVARIVEQLKRDNYRFSTLVVGIVSSEPFRYAKVESRPGPGAQSGESQNQVETKERNNP